jgi:hypothetical protein
LLLNISWKFPDKCRAPRNAFPTLRVSPSDAQRKQEEKMKKLALGVGAAALLTAATAAPAMAQVGFYAGPFGVGVGAPAYYDCGYYGYPCGYYDYYGGPDIVVGGGWGGGWHHRWNGGHAHFHHR